MNVPSTSSSLVNNNNNNNKQATRHQTNLEALLGTVKMLRLGTKQVHVCRDALDRLQRILTFVPASKKNNGNKARKIGAVSSINLAGVDAGASTTTDETNPLLVNTPANRLSAVEVRNLRRHFALNTVGGPGVLMNALQVVGTDVAVAESALSLMVTLLFPSGSSPTNVISSSGVSVAKKSIAASLSFHPLLPKMKGRSRIALRKLVKKFIKKSGTRLLFALLVKHFDPTLPLSYIRGIVFPVCKLIHCFVLGDPKLASAARLSGALQVLTRIVLAFIQNTNKNLNSTNDGNANNNNTNNNNPTSPTSVSSAAATAAVNSSNTTATAAASSSSSSSTLLNATNTSLVNDCAALELIIPGILSTIATLCNVKLSLAALSRNGLGVASLLNLIRNVVSLYSPDKNGQSSSSVITTQSILRWSFKLILNYLIVDSSANTKIALENNVVDICIMVLEKFSLNSSFTQLHCVILDVLTLLVYGTSSPVLNEINNNNNSSSSNNNNNKQRPTIIPPERERQIIKLIARAACSPQSSNHNHQANPRDVIDLYNQLCKFIGMTELPIASHTDGTDLVYSPPDSVEHEGCPQGLLKKGSGESSSDDDDDGDDENEDGTGNDIFSKLSSEEKKLVERYEEKMCQRVALLFPELNIASLRDNPRDKTTIPEETFFNTREILQSSNNSVKKVHYPQNSSSTRTPLHRRFSTTSIPPAWPSPQNAHTENVLAVEPVPHDPLPDNVFRQLAQNQFLRLVDPSAVTAQIVYENVVNRSKQLPRVYSNPPHQDLASSLMTMKQNNNNKNNSFSLPPLQFDSNFECGNLKRVIRIGDADYDIITSGDTNTERQGQWFYFSVQGMVKGVQYTFRFINFERAGSTFGAGNRPLMYSEQLYSECKNGWLRVGEEIAYFKNSFLKPSSKLTAESNTNNTNSSSSATATGKSGAATSTAKTGKKKASSKKVGDDDQDNNNEEEQQQVKPATKKKKQSQQQQQPKKEVTVQSLIKSQPTMNTLHVSIRFPFSNDRVYLCPGLPYSYTDLVRYLHFLPQRSNPDCVESFYRPSSSSSTVKEDDDSASNTRNDDDTESKNALEDLALLNPGCMMIQTFCHSDSGLPVPIITITQLYKEDPTPLATAAAAASVDNPNHHHSSSSSFSSGNGGGGTGFSSSSYYASQQFLRRTPVSPQEMAARPVCVVSARVHPGETVSSFTAKGLIDYLVDPLNPVAKALRQSTVWKIIPMLNPDGVVHGHYRCDLHGYDLNRMFHPTPIAIRTPTVAYLNQLFKHMRTQQPTRKVVFYGDFHGHSKKTGCFTYGCGSSKKAVHGAVVESIFPAVLHSLLPGFDPEGCTYKVQQGKVATGRVVAYRNHNIRMSYTLEVSLMGGWRFAPISTCEDDEIIERDAVRRRRLVQQQLQHQGDDELLASSSMPSIETVRVPTAGSSVPYQHHHQHDDDDQQHQPHQQYEPELVLNTPHSLCAIGAMFVKSFYCVAENFLAVRAEDLFRIKKPTAYDDQGNIIRSTYEMQSLPRRGVVAETAAGLLIAHARLERRRRAQLLERKIQVKVQSKLQQANSNNNNAASSSMTTITTTTNNENFFMGIQVPPHQIQEALAASLSFSAQKGHQLSQQQTTMLTMTTTSNITENSSTNETKSTTSTKKSGKSSSSTTTKGGKKNSSMSSSAMASSSFSVNNNNSDPSYHPLEDQFQVTVTWGGKLKETGVVVGNTTCGGTASSSSSNTTTTNATGNIISTNIHTPLWATSISPGGLIVEKSSARQEALRESYTQRGKTPTIFGGGVDSGNAAVTSAGVAKNNGNNKNNKHANGAAKSSSSKKQQGLLDEDEEADEDDAFEDENDDDDEEDDMEMFDDDEDDDEEDDMMMDVEDEDDDDEEDENVEEDENAVVNNNNNSNDDNTESVQQQQQQNRQQGALSTNSNTKRSSTTTLLSSDSSRASSFTKSTSTPSTPTVANTNQQQQQQKTPKSTNLSRKSSSSAKSTVVMMSPPSLPVTNNTNNNSSSGVGTMAPLPPRLARNNSNSSSTATNTTTSTTRRTSDPKTTNPKIQYAGALARNRKP